MTKTKFSEEEEKWITDSFRRTLIHFAENPLDRDNDDDIRKALV